MNILKTILGIVLLIVALFLWLGVLGALLKPTAYTADVGYNSGYLAGQLMVGFFTIGAGGGIFVLGLRLIRSSRSN